MDASDIEVRLFLQHLAQWIGAFSQRQVSECTSAIDSLAERGRILASHPDFQALFESHRERFDATDPVRAVGEMCALLLAVTKTDRFSHYRSES